MADSKKQSSRAARAAARTAPPPEPDHDAANTAPTSAESSREASPQRDQSEKRVVAATGLDWVAEVEAEENQRDHREETLVDNERITVREPLVDAEAHTLTDNTQTITLPPRIEFSIVSQYSRLTYLQHSQARAQQFSTDRITLIELESEAAQLDKIWECFHNQHEAFADSCSEAFFSHKYMTEQVYDQGLQAHLGAHQRYSQLRAHLTPPLDAGASLGSSHSLNVSAHLRNLPEIPLPEFSGDYSAWPSFKDLFTSLIINDPSVSKVGQMHYLKSCVKDSAAKLISTLPIAADSFDSAWEALTARYENKRLLISTHLDKLFQLKTPQSRSASALQALLSTSAEALNALQVLGSPIEHWDQFLVYLLTQKIDSHTREAWENKLGSSTEFPTFAQLKTFLSGRARALERLEASQPESSSTQPKTSKTTSRTAHNAVATQRDTQGTSSSNSFPCDCCQGNHYIVTCSKFRELPPPSRRKLVEEQRLCFNCLGHHSARSCNSTKCCRTCGEKHHTMIHKQSRLPTQSVLLATSQALLITALCTHPVRLLIDPGSELTFIKDQQVKLINLRRQHSRIPISGIGGATTTSTRGVTQVTLRSLHSSESVSLNAHILNSLTSVLPTFVAPQDDWTHLNGLQLADPDFLTPQPVDLIIGADSYGRIIKQGLRKLDDNSPIAQLTLFGWIVLGPVSSTHCSFTSVSHHATVDEKTQQLHELITKFWTQQEAINSNPVEFTADEEECENHFASTHQRDSSGRYIVRLPFKSSVGQLGDSYLNAQRILHRLLRRLSKDSTYQQLYKTFLEEYEELSHMKKATHSSSDSTAYYLPHHGVLRPTSSTTKLRVVFNGSSPSSSGISLNDLLHTGPKIQRDISDVLLWVRKHKYVFATDISKMFRQIAVHPDDWKHQRILWINSAGEVLPYELTTVTYGTRAAPFLAVRTLEQLIKDEGNRFPLAVEPLTAGRYVDDIYGGSDNLEDLIEVARQVREICTAGCFPLAKWQSNHRELLKSISADSEALHSRPLDDSSTTLLGLTWFTYSDTFRFHWNPPDQGSRLTKRLILSEIAQLYDPLGFLAPLIVRAKVLLQELWLFKLSWDDSLPSATQQRWLQLKEELAQVSSLRIPRWLGLNDHSTVQIHGFSDASQLAMAAVIYLRVGTQTSRGKCTILCSKSRVAPLKKLTIPRLELTAALLLARLTQYVVRTLSLAHAPVYLWTDSSVTLTWITSHPSRWKDFVGNRVSQIQDLTPNCEWRFISGKENPADCASRGVTLSQLENHQLWWSGPPWLSQSTRSWPAQRNFSNSQVHQEERPGLSLTAASVHPVDQWDLIYRYSSLTRLLRVTATVRRAIHRFKKMPRTTVKNPLTPHELNSSLKFWIRSTQAANFKFELTALNHSTPLPKSHAFTRLTAFIDTEGIIRVGGRLDNSPLDPESKHPAVLPRNSHLSGLLIADAHTRTLHGGTQLTLNLLRQSVWIIGGRAPIRSFILRCLKCARLRGNRAQQLMGQLPSTRVTPSRPFTTTGVDYAGPLAIKTWKGRGAKSQKGWLCIFVCFSTSAVHLEVVSDYSADAFLAAFRRFTGRRGLCHTLRSDCGTTFIGADTMLKKLFTQGSQEQLKLADSLTHDRVRWDFIPPAAPHMGGKWEAAVKSVKYHLRRTVGETLLTYEELTTLLIQIEAVLNSRPLEPLTDDPTDTSALTPGHFLIGQPLNSVVEPSLLDLNMAHLDRWQFIQQRFQHFWNRWSAQYLHQHLTISKWHHPSHEIKVGSLVLLTDERFPPSKWPLARVTHLHPGKDGLTRVVTLRTATTTLTRPIVKLAILPSTAPDSTS